MANEKLSIQVQRFGSWEFHLNEGLRAGAIHSDGSLIVEVVDINGKMGYTVVETFVFRGGKLYKVWGLSQLKPIKVKIDNHLKRIIVLYNDNHLSSTKN